MEMDLDLNLDLELQLTPDRDGVVDKRLSGYLDGWTWLHVVAFSNQLQCSKMESRQQVAEQESEMTSSRR